MQCAPCDDNSARSACKKRKTSDSDGTVRAPRKKQESRIKCWMFTTNNPLDADVPTPHSLVTACVWQKERGNDGTVHFQGYLEVEPKMRLAELKKKISFLSRSHLERRLGSRAEARNYCTKADTRIEGPWAFGDIETTGQVPETKGRRSDLAEVATKLLAGATVESLLNDHGPSIMKYYRGMKYFEMQISKKSCPRFRHLSVTVLWGPTGTGKTRKALELAGDDFYMLCKSNNKQLWFDGYTGQKTLIMDEFRSSWCSFEVLLRILDGHPFQPEQKGGHVWAAWDKVIMTSNIDPVTWYSRNAIPDQTPLFRRITEIFCVDQPIYTDVTFVDVRDKPIKYWPIFGQASESKKDEDKENKAPEPLPPIVPSGSVADAAMALGDMSKDKAPDDPIIVTDDDKTLSSGDEMKPYQHYDSYDDCECSQGSGLSSADEAVVQRNVVHALVPGTVDSNRVDTPYGLFKNFK